MRRAGQASTVRDSEVCGFMRWDQAATYIIGSLLVIGGAVSLLEPADLMIAFGGVLIAFALLDGPHGVALLYRDVKRHIRR